MALTGREIVSLAARTTSSNSGAITDSAAATKLRVALRVTAQSGTTPTLDVSVEWSYDGTVFFQAQPADNFTQITTTTPAVTKVFDVKAPIYRVVWAIAGTTPSYTFSVTASDDVQD